MRKPIVKLETVELGYIKKTSGVKGEILLTFTAGYDEVVEELEFVFFEIDGLLVPFFIEHLKIRNDETAVVKFEQLKNQEEAKEFTGCKVFIPNELVADYSDELSPQMLVGFTLIDHKIGTIGEIIEVNDFNGNFVMTANYIDTEVMVPLAEELILSLEEETKTIIMQCPDGLFELNDQE